MISVSQTILFLPSNLVSFPIALLFLHPLYSTHTIFSLLESYSSVCGAFLDLRKAFDSVPHQPLLDLLASSNLPLPLLNRLHSYLLNRTQCVVVNGSSSSSLLASSGVPQGSSLGPLLFLIYVNGLTDLPFSPLTRLILYADIIFIFKPISSSADMSSFQSDLDSISSWLFSHFLQILLTLSALFTQTTLFVHLLENLLFIIPTFLLPFAIGTLFLPHLKKLTLSPSSSLS